VVEMRVPSSFLKGSGSLELAVKEPGSDTAQPAPSSSTPAVAPRLMVAAVIAPATASAATASTTTVERILERPKLMITRALLPGSSAVGRNISVNVSIQFVRSCYRHCFGNFNAPETAVLRLKVSSPLKDAAPGYYLLEQWRTASSSTPHPPADRRDLPGN
jgi:hypothetical protein